MYGGSLPVTEIKHADRSFSSASDRPPESAAMQDRLAPQEPALALRVLVVDDNHDAAESMAVLLGLLGSQVHICYDGLEAVKAFSEFVPRVVLLDIGLPKLDGHAAAARIRALPGGESVTLIALSGYGRDEDFKRSSEAGFDHHLVKPVAPDTLIGLLAGVASGAAV